MKKLLAVLLSALLLLGLTATAFAADDDETGEDPGDEPVVTVGEEPYDPEEPEDPAVDEIDITVNMPLCGTVVSVDNLSDVAEVYVDPEGVTITELTLALDCTDETKALWPHDFALQLKVSVSMKLNMGLKTTNTGTEPFEITEGFHPYFLVRDRDTITVRGLDGCPFCDARRTHELAILDPGLRRAIAIASRGNAKVVCWNPSASGVPNRNLGADDWKKFVCVEPATLFKEDAAITIQPGESHELLMAIQSVPEK